MGGGLDPAGSKSEIPSFIACPHLQKNRARNEQEHTMQNTPSAPNSSSLRARVMSGERPDTASIDDVSELLAMSEGGITDPARACRASNALSQYMKDGRINLVDTGSTRPVLNTFGMWIVGKDGGSKNSPFTLEQKVFSLSWIELQKVRELLIRDNLWSSWGDRWCGYKVEVSEPLVDKSTKANTKVRFQEFKRRIVGKFTGNIDSLHRHRNDTDRSQPYATAFNDDGSVNEDEFQTVAIARGEWKGEKALEPRDTEGADIKSVYDVFKGWGVR